MKRSNRLVSTILKLTQMLSKRQRNNLMNLNNVFNQLLYKMENLYQRILHQSITKQINMQSTKVLLKYINQTYKQSQQQKPVYQNQIFLWGRVQQLIPQLIYKNTNHRKNNIYPKLKDSQLQLITKKQTLFTNQDLKSKLINVTSVHKPIKDNLNKQMQLK
jgi:hypothetical protein